MCSLGISVDIVKTAIEHAEVVIAQVNPQMPRTFGDSSIPIETFDYLVPVDLPLIEYRIPDPTTETAQIGRYIAALVEDGSTIELGIGRTPHAILEYLKDKKDLGIHTELFSDEVIDLIEEGVVTGARKTGDPGKVVASFCMGSNRLYRYIDNNPGFCFRPTEYVNDPAIISQQYKMIAVNTALEVDLTGQVCSDSLGSEFYSGIGGQLDFSRGATRSEGGKSIIALPSRACKGTVSRIVSRLSPGAGVVVPRADVDYVVTEYGVAYLHGKTIQERAIGLISIAHPDYHEQLLREAMAANYVRNELISFADKIVYGPLEFLRTVFLKDETPVKLRTIQPTDEVQIKRLFHALSPDSIYYRFFAGMKLARSQIHRFVYINHRDEIAIVAVIPHGEGDTIVALGGYVLDPATNQAELAIAVQDSWQRHGIGSAMVKHLIAIARGQGIRGITADVLAVNRGMISVLEHSGLKWEKTLDRGIFHLEAEF